MSFLRGQDLLESPVIDSLWDGPEDTFPPPVRRHHDVMPLVANDFDIGSHKQKPAEHLPEWLNCLPEGLLPTDVMDVTKEATWTVSSVRDQQGAGLMLTDDLGEFWESDGQLPHHIFCEFPTAIEVIGFVLNLNHNSDESFTPRKITAEMTSDVNWISSDWDEYFFSKPNGWVFNRLYEGEQIEPTSCWAIRITIPELHDGRNVRIRAIRVLALSSSANSKDGLARSSSVPTAHARSSTPPTSSCDPTSSVIPQRMWNASKIPG
uniref:Anaphase-promoting complex subunit 10 n=1 Tax=Steinernema glaseri TaxID=37863 RepID=A0A1I7ZTQ0_9BILA